VASLVSVIIPCYNRGSLLRQALASCALQTHRDLEIIVVDDGSEEDLRAVVDGARDKHRLGSQLQYVHQERGGGASARNCGFRKASGQFIQFLDSDDLLHPDKLTIQVAQLVGNAHLDMVFCLDEQFADIPGDLRLLWNVPRRSDASDHLSRFLVEDTVWQTGSPLWRRTALERIGPWDESLLCWQDWDLHVRALSAGLRCECSVRVLQYLRRHRGPRVQSLSPPERERHCFQAGKNAVGYLSRNGLLDSERRILILRYFVKHLVCVTDADDHQLRGLRVEMLTFMQGLALTRKRRLAIGIMRMLASTPLFTTALNAYLAQTSYEARVQSLRNIVFGEFLAPPPEELTNVVRQPERRCAAATIRSEIDGASAPGSPSF